MSVTKVLEVDYGISRMRVITIISLIPEARVEFTEAPYKQQISYGLDSSRIRKMGFKPEGSLERGVGEIIEHLKALIPKR